MAVMDERQREGPWLVYDAEAGAYLAKVALDGDKPYMKWTYAPERARAYKNPSAASRCAARINERMGRSCCRAVNAARAERAGRTGDETEVHAL